MADPPTSDEMWERFKATLGEVLQVSKDEMLKMERAQKAKRPRQQQPGVMVYHYPEEST
jgi:hypothetical protein